MPSTLATLPSDILPQIAKHLPPEEAMRFMQLNKHFYASFHTLLKDEAYWGKAVKQYFPANNAMRRSELSNLAYLSSFDQYARLHQQYYEGLPARHVQLFLAVKSRDLLSLQKIRLSFNELSIFDAAQNNLYVTIARIGHQPTMDYVFSAIITPYYQDEDGLSRTKKDALTKFTLLQHAARLNQVPAIDDHFKWVAATKAPNQAYDYRKTPLHLAAECNHTASVKALIKHGEAVNTLDHAQDPLHLAAANGHDATVKILLAHGAHVNGNNPYARSPLYLAAASGHLNTFNRCLQSGANLHLPNEATRTTLLHAAIEGGNLDMLDQVIAMNAFAINATNDHQETPLLYAASIGNFPAFNRLLTLGADPRETDNRYENSLLHFALVSMNTAIIKAIFELEAQEKVIGITTTANNRGETPLHYAACCKKTNPEHNKIFDLLLEKATNIDPLTIHEETPLYCAADNREDTYAVEALLKKEADPNIATTRERTPLHALMKTPLNHCLAKLRHLITYKANPNAQDDEGNTPLHYAAQNRQGTLKDDSSIFELLIKSGANIKAVNRNNETPMQYLLKEMRLANLNLLGTLIAHGETMPNLNDLNLTNVDHAEFFRALHLIFKDLHEKQKHTYATRALATIYETGKKGINQDLFAAKKLYAMVSDANSVARVEAKLKQLWNPGLFSSPQTESKHPSEEKDASPKRQKPC